MKSLRSDVLYRRHPGNIGSLSPMISRTVIHLALLGCVVYSAAAQSSTKWTAAPDSPRRVVLTTDIGAEVDDQWALAHLAVAPEIELRGVVTTHAPRLAVPAAHTAARVARDVLKISLYVVMCRSSRVQASRSNLALRH